MLGYEDADRWTDGRRTDDLIPSELSTLRVRMRIYIYIYIYIYWGRGRGMGVWEYAPKIKKYLYRDKEVNPTYVLIKLP